MWNYLMPLDVVTLAGYAPPGRMACERNRFAILHAIRRKKAK